MKNITWVACVIAGALAASYSTTSRAAQQTDALPVAVGSTFTLDRGTCTVLAIRGHWIQCGEAPQVGGRVTPGGPKMWVNLDATSWIILNQ